VERLIQVSDGWHPDGRRIGAKIGEMAYVVDAGGTGAPIVFLHGIMVSSWSWRHMITALHPEFRPVAICMRGFGWSDKPPGKYDIGVLGEHVMSVLDALHIERAYFVGNSLGGAVALRLALEYPRRVLRLALLAPAAVRLDHVSWLLPWQHRKLGPMYELVGKREVYRRFLQVMAYGGKPVDDDTMHHFMEPLRSGDTVRVAATICRTLVQDAHYLLDHADQITQKTLLCWGTRDGLVPIPLARPLLARLPNVTFQRYRGIGHCPMEECPTQFADDLTAFLREAPAA